MNNNTLNTNINYKIRAYYRNHIECLILNNTCWYRYRYKQKHTFMITSDGWALCMSIWAACWNDSWIKSIETICSKMVFEMRLQFFSLTILLFQCVRTEKRTFRLLTLAFPPNFTCIFFFQAKMTFPVAVRRYFRISPSNLI